MEKITQFLVLHGKIDRLFARVLHQLNDKLAWHNYVLEFHVRFWHTSGLNLDEHVFKDSIKICNEAIADAAMEVLIVKTHHHMLIGMMIDEIAWKGMPAKNMSKADWETWIKNLISQVKHIPIMTQSLFPPKDAVSQHAFHNRVVRSYVPRALPHQIPEVWCVVSGRYWPYTIMKSATLVHFNIGEIPARYTFGEDYYRNRNIFSHDNGLPMMERFKMLYEKARIAFLPVDEANGFFWKVLVLDNTLLDEEKHEEHVPWGRDLDRRLLKFPTGTNARPKPKNAYFGLCANILLRQRYEKPGWWRSVKLHGALPGRYIVRPALRALACRIALMDVHEADELVKEFGAALEIQGIDGEFADNMVVETMMTAPAHSFLESDEDDEDKKNRAAGGSTIESQLFGNNDDTKYIT
ncbi:hypothetical protein F4819DRAFT_445098 [Hypoxylon fuscum]|nr:hypothetical protein F4819DRAFT_445098 [Hypoxylon fuscum]